ncbi:MAG TPA: hypothetical protein VFV05_16675 [Methylomirabilota bacterium]|nr:hypothetical protein [Methylomirabilota bacterium]
MGNNVVGIVAIVAMLVGVLLWRGRQDRRRERAQAVRARTNAALFRALGGDALIAVQVEAPWLWRRGRVVLSAPADWHRVLARVWSGVVAQVPADYELVVKLLAPAPRAPETEDHALRRAA